MNDLEEIMLNGFDRLKGDERDDVESQYENLRVLLEQTIEESNEHGQKHVPALELHVGMLMEAFMDQHDAVMAQLIVGVPVETTERTIRQLVYNYFKGCMMFGKKVGEIHWPVKSYKCEEVHSND